MEFLLQPIRRVRTGAAAPGRAPCPGRQSALEKAIRGFADKPGSIVIVPALGTSFDTLGEAYNFYNLYSWEKGFGIRYGKSRLTVERTKCMQEIVCGCAGKASVENTRSCRCECRYRAFHTDAARKEKWCRVLYKVNVIDGGEQLDCECGQFAHTGLLCSHVLKVLDFICITEIPQKHIMKRWTRDARDILPVHLNQYQRDNAHNNPYSFRHYTMYMHAMEMVRMGDASVEAYEKFMSLIKNCIVEMQPFAEVRDGLGLEDRVAEDGDVVNQMKAQTGGAAVNGGAVMRSVNDDRDSANESVNRLAGMLAPNKRKEMGRPSTSREKAP